MKGVAVQPDGKILLGGYTWAGGTGDFVVVRLNSDGSYDSSFGNNGISILDSGKTEVLSAIKLLADGRIITSGYVNDNFAMAALKADGSIDSSFGEGGWVVTPFENAFSYTTAIGIDHAGRILLTGMVMGNDATTKIGLARYSANGSLDSTFGTDGKLIYGYRGNNDYGIGIAIQADGKIVVAGHSYLMSIPVLQYDIIAVRFNDDGRLDSSYGTDGVALARVGAQNYTSRMLMQPDEKIVIVGNLINGNDYNAIILRFSKEGNLDTDFNTTGYFAIDMGVDKSVEGTAVALQDDGKAILAGHYFLKSSGNQTMFAQRYMTTPLGTADFKKNQIQVYPNPVADFITVNLNNVAKSATLEVLNMNGQLVSSQKIDQSSKVDLSQLAKGVYILKFKTASKTETLKIVKE